LPDKNGDHNHEPKALRIGTAKTLNAMKEKAKNNPRTRTCQIVQEIAKLLRVPAQRNFPSRNQLIQTAQRAKKSKTGLVEPTDFNFEVDPEYLLATEDNRRSLYVVKDVSFGDVHGIIIFSSKTLLGFLAKLDY
jgi:hypothetical protein